MTTKVTVDAHAGWPVKVETINPKTGEVDGVHIVPPKTTADFFIYDTRDIRVHEVQPDETHTVDYSTGGKF